MPKAGCISGPRSSNRLRAILLNVLTVAPVLCLNPCFGQAAHRVTAVRFWSTGDSTRIAVEVSGEFKYKSDTLETPPRLFFDVQGSRPAMAQKTIPVGDRLLKQIRVAETQPGTTRVVLDLEQPADFTASQLSNPERLMIELHAKGTKPSAPAIAPDAIPLITSTPAKTDPAKALPPPPSESEPPAVAKKPDPAVVAKVLPSPAVLTPVSRPISTSAKATAPRKVELPEPKPAARNSDGDRSLTRGLGLKRGRVVLDPGHGGHDAGTHGPSGLTEKELVLDVSQRLSMLLQDRLGSDVVLTRTDDTFIPLEGRTKIANDAKADLFLSIHANSSPVKSVTGVETYYLNVTTSRGALDLAARENATAESSIFDLKDVLEKIALHDKIDESREFAARLQTSLFTLTKSTAATKNRGIKKAPFVVLIGAQMPSVLAEIGFLTNSSDEALMRKTEHRQKIAEALYKGIAAYAESLSQLQVAKRE